MDNFTRNYSILLGLVVVIAIGFWIKSSWQPRVGELSAVLESDSQLAAWHYQFRVVDFDDGTAIISTPRSPEFPAIRFLTLIHPELADKAQDDPAMIAAQQDLIDHQKRAQGLILAQPGVERVDWQLDRQWLSQQGVVPSSR